MWMLASNYFLTRKKKARSVIRVKPSARKKVRQNFNSNSERKEAIIEGGWVGY
jgi:hypothetical protein